MIVAKNSYSNNHYAYDSYAYDYRRYENESNNTQKKNKSLGKKKKTNIKNRLQLMFAVLLILCSGTLIISRYAMIMKMNNQCIELKKKIAANQKENENLKLQLSKYYDIKQIEKNATEELTMVRPTDANIVYVSVTGDNKDSVLVSDANNLSKPKMIDKILELFN